MTLDKGGFLEFTGLVLLLALLSTSFASKAYANAEAARKAIDEKDYATALQVLRPLAANDNAAAQYELGKLYGKGKGVEKDDAEAVKWFRMAADQGVAGAQTDLGAMYATGEGVTKDYTEAFKCWNRGTVYLIAIRCRWQPQSPESLHRLLREDQGGG